MKFNKDQDQRSVKILKMEQKDLSQLSVEDLNASCSKLIQNTL